MALSTSSRALSWAKPLPAETSDEYKTIAVKRIRISFSDCQFRRWPKNPALDTGRVPNIYSYYHRTKERNMTRICPRCGESLKERPFGNVALDGCSGCGGIWF